MRFNTHIDDEKQEHVAINSRLVRFEQYRTGKKGLYIGEQIWYHSGITDGQVIDNSQDRDSRGHKLKCDINSSTHFNPSEYTSAKRSKRV